MKVCKDTSILQESSFMSCQNGVFNTSVGLEPLGIQGGAHCKCNENTKICFPGT